MNYYLEAWKKYAVFSGRAQRAEYWTFCLVNMVIIFMIFAIDEAINAVPIKIAGGIFLLAMFLPIIAVSVRRLHDTGRSGWWLFIKLIPLVGSIVILVFTLLDSQPGDNKYGKNPKVVASSTQPSPLQS